MLALIIQEVYPRPKTDAVFAEILGGQPTVSGRCQRHAAAELKPYVPMLPQMMGWRSRVGCPFCSIWLDDPRWTLRYEPDAGGA